MVFVKLVGWKLGLANNDDGSRGRLLGRRLVVINIVFVSIMVVMESLVGDWSLMRR